MTTQPQMDARTLKALRASIEHWEENAAVGDIDNARVARDDCALCGLFWVVDDEMCRGCPVSSATGKGRCYRTPFIAAAEAWARFNLIAFREAAAEEVRFLQSLWPAGAEE